MTYDHFFDAHMNARFWFFYEQGFRSPPHPVTGELPR